MPSNKTRILVVDDDHNLSQILLNILDYEGYQSTCVDKGKTAVKMIQENEFDLMLLDLSLPDMSGLEVLKKIQDFQSTLEVVIISGEGTIGEAVAATRMGAFDFLEKPLDSERVLVTIKNAIEKRQLEKTKKRLIENVKERYVMIGDSSEMKDVYQLIQKAANTDCKVLIEGENGTGKELVARAIYINSMRSGEPFIAVNCAAIPESLIESELFGHKKGSFTGAVADKIGKFQAADGGTLFLDEIGDMSVMTQSKVLRVLEDNKVEMIGSNKPVQVDVRIIAATNRNLAEMMEMETFRDDLYYRLNVLNIQLPPLRDRREDIPELVQYYIEKFSREQGVKEKKVTVKALQRLKVYKWPGNVRELRNFVEKLVTLVDDTSIRPEHISPLLKTDFSLKSNNKKSLKDAKHDFEKRLITSTLKACNGSISKAAGELQIPRTYLYKKIKNLEIEC